MDPGSDVLIESGYIFFSEIREYLELWGSWTVGKLSCGGSIWSCRGSIWSCGEAGLWGQYLVLWEAKLWGQYLVLWGSWNVGAVSSAMGKLSCGGSIWCCGEAELWGKYLVLWRGCAVGKVSCGGSIWSCGKLNCGEYLLLLGSFLMRFYFPSCGGNT